MGRHSITVGVDKEEQVRTRCDKAEIEQEGVELLVPIS